MRDIKINEKSRTIEIDGKATTVRWTVEAEEDMKSFYELDIKTELAKMIIEALVDYKLSEEEKIYIMELFKED